MSPDTLNLALPRLSAMKQFQGIQLADLEAIVFASAVTGTNELQLSAFYSTPEDATTLVTAVYQALEDRIHNDRAPVLNGLRSSLNTELAQIQANQTDTTSEIQTLNSEGRGYTYQARLLGSLQAEEQHLITNINDLLLTLNQRDTAGEDLLSLGSPTPTMTTTPASGSTQGLRIGLSPLIGLIMGIGGALLASRFSTRLPLRGKKRELVLPHIAAIIPTLPGFRKEPLATLMIRAALCLPLLRRLRYQSSEYEKPLQFITVTSPKSQEGKSTIATCLALASAQSGQRTLLVDANLQRPVLDTWFQQTSVIGLRDSVRYLANGISGPSPLQTTTIPNLMLMTIGKTEGAEATDILPIDGLSPLLQLLKSEADLIIFDGPALLSSSDAINLAMLSDVVLLVVNAHTSKSGTVLEAEEQLKTTGITFTTILNQARREFVK